MRKHGWQIPYHPLQVVAVAVFMALGFAFYVFFAPFVGKKLLQYIAMGLYTPLIICVFGLYIWCAASDPADPGVFKSKKYLRAAYNKKSTPAKESNLSGDSGQDASVGDKTFDKNIKDAHVAPHKASRFSALCGFVCNSSDRCEKSSKQHTSEDGMYYCSLCEVEVFKYSKHCRVCDKCVDHFDHHCRWINNCIGKRNYWKFFALMVSALLMLILQWSTGILVLICCFIEKKRFYANITSNLGSSFSLVPFVIVVAVCTILAMIATLPIAQLFFFHILLIRKGLSTYDYVIAMREQDQQGVEGQQSPQMSTVSSLNGLSSASSFNAFHRAAWCTPPPLFAEDHQFDVVPPENGSVSSLGRKTQVEEAVKKKSHPAVKISPWTLARLNSEDVSRAAAEARSKSKILQPVGPSGAQTATRYDNNKRRPSKRAPLHLAFDDALRNDTTQAQPGLGGMVMSSPESSLASPDLRVSMTAQKEPPLSASTSDGYDASGGEDSDRVPTRFVQRSAQWSALLLGSSPIERDSRFMLPSSSSSQSNIISRI